MINMTQTVGRHLGLLEIHVRAALRDRLTDDRGEGVISMAIAILIIATIGAVMYTLFLGTGEDPFPEAAAFLDHMFARLLAPDAQTESVSEAPPS